MVYKITRIDGSYSIVGSLDKSFREEGLEPIDLDGKIIMFYSTNEDVFFLNSNLSEEELNAAVYLEKAYRFLKNIHESRMEKVNNIEVKFYAASQAISLEEIIRYREGIKMLSTKEIAKKYNIPIEFVQMRIETLQLKDPDFYIKINERYEPETEEGIIVDSATELDIQNNDYSNTLN